MLLREQPNIGDALARQHGAYLKFARRKLGLPFLESPAFLPSENEAVRFGKRVGGQMILERRFGHRSGGLVFLLFGQLHASVSSGSENRLARCSICWLSLFTCLVLSRNSFLSDLTQIVAFTVSAQGRPEPSEHPIGINQIAAQFGMG